MLLWLSFAILSAVVLAALLRPLLRPAGEVAGQAAAGRAVYRDQLAEIDSDRAAGLIGEAEAEAARRELARRLLAEADKDDSATSTGSASPGPSASGTGSGFGRYTAFVVGITLLPALGLLVYQATGSPGLPAQPHDVRVAQRVERNSVDELVARVEARLREHPEDGQGWDVLGPVYLRQERFREAAEAFSAAIRLLGPNAKRLTGFAEATVISNNGIVGDDAKAAYEQVIELEPGHIEARFWLAMAREQDGALADAAAAYRALLAEAPQGAPWRGSVEERLAAVTQRMGAAGTPTTVPATVPATGAGLGAAPSRDGAKSIESLPAEERGQAIAGMVDGLAARLKQDGSDLEGWLRLLRAYKVMGRHDAATAALADARKAMQGKLPALSALDALARELGIGS